MRGAHLFQVDSVQFMTGAAKVEVAPGSVVGHVPAILANHWVIASLGVIIMSVVGRVVGLLIGLSFH